jgi:GTP cyclohydrolase IA
LNEHPDWESLNEAFIKVFSSKPFTPYAEHLKDTPNRVVALFKEYFSGMDKDPSEVLRKGFSEKFYDEMILLKDIPFTSTCAHHIVPFLGKVHFAYMPHQRIVGLSKIPRMIEVLSHRPQVQENLTREIVDCFQNTVEPKGCGAVLEARHMCMEVRGVCKEGIITRTVALAGCFLKPDIKEEFLRGC